MRFVVVAVLANFGKSSANIHRVFLYARIQSAPQIIVKANVIQKSNISILTASETISSNILSLLNNYFFFTA